MITTAPEPTIDLFISLTMGIYIRARWRHNASLTLEQRQISRMTYSILLIRTAFSSLIQLHTIVNLARKEHDYVAPSHTKQTSSEQDLNESHLIETIYQSIESRKY